MSAQAGKGKRGETEYEKEAYSCVAYFTHGAVLINFYLC